jgi:hypothetical protein
MHFAFAPSRFALAATASTNAWWPGVALKTKLAGPGTKPAAHVIAHSVFDAVFSHKPAGSALHSDAATLGVSESGPTFQIWKLRMVPAKTIGMYEAGFSAPPRQKLARSCAMPSRPAHARLPWSSGISIPSQYNLALASVPPYCSRIEWNSSS